MANMFIEIQLGGSRAQGRVALVSETDAAEVLKYRWSLDGTGRYANARINGKTTLLHRFIMKPKRWEIVDHINNDGLDCRQENMRVCTPVQNARNRHKQFSNSGYKGVYFNRQTGRYNSYIGYQKMHIWLGAWDTAEMAARAYATAVRDLHGEFGCAQAEPFPQSLAQLRDEIAQKNPNRREATKVRNDNTSGVSGIHWNAQVGKWRVRRKGVPHAQFRDLNEAKSFLAQHLQQS